MLGRTKHPVSYGTRERQPTASMVSSYCVSLVGQGKARRSCGVSLLWQEAVDTKQSWQPLCKGCPLDWDLAHFRMALSVGRVPFGIILSNDFDLKTTFVLITICCDTHKKNFFNLMLRQTQSIKENY